MSSDPNPDSESALGWSPRSTESRVTARQRLRRGEGWIVFHHFRKCAGTSVRRMLLESMIRRAGMDPEPNFGSRQVWRVGGSHFYTQEWGSFVPAHLAHEPPVVLATCLRHPIHRIASEFHYAGPGADRSLDGAELLARWRKWIETPYKRRGRAGVVRGAYLDNFFIRSLIGRPPEGPDAVRLHPHIPYFGAYRLFGGGGPLYPGAVGRPELEAALQALAAFDIVLTTGRLQDPSALEELRQFLDDSELHAGHLRRSRPYPGVPPEIEGILRRSNAWDLELFNTARRYPTVRVC